MLFEHQEALDDLHLLTYANLLNLDLADFERALLAHQYEGRVREDFMSGVRSGVNGTPTFFINGARYDGSPDLDSLLVAIRAVAEDESG